ncbi:MAG: hypothetical protein HY912_21510, partial [Desulfomonile tiedjei]|nr:hypothetical protein [Desulfomonile tiedjei]
MHKAVLFPALRIGGIYTFLGVLWIVGSDKLLAMILSDPTMLTAIQT